MGNDTPFNHDVNTIFSLLEEERPLVVKPKLAAIIGLNEAIILQQIKYWITNPLNKNIRQGKVWVYKTYQEWHQEFPFFSLPTIKRTILSLEEKGLIVSSNFNQSTIDRTKWYTINLPSNTSMMDRRMDQIDPSMGSKRSIHGINLIHSNHRLPTYTTHIDKQTNARAREDVFYDPVVISEFWDNKTPTEEDAKRLFNQAGEVFLEKKISEEDASRLFKGFYKKYPLKKGKARAEKLWIRKFRGLKAMSAISLLTKIATGLVNQCDEAVLIEVLRADFPNEKVFYPAWQHCDTWINNCKWEDEFFTNYEGAKNEFVGRQTRKI